MRKLNKIRLQNAVVLENREMKQVLGGSGSQVCAYSNTHTGVALCVPLGGGADQAEFWAGSGGWWCCNCAEAYNACGL